MLSRGANDERLLSAVDFLSVIRDLCRSCIKNGDKLAIDAATHLFLSNRHLEDGIEVLDHNPDWPSDEREVYLQEPYRRAFESAYSPIETTAARIIIELERKELPLSAEPLTRRAQAVFSIIQSNRPLTGKAIIGHLDKQASDDISSLDQATLTKEVIPELKVLRGIKNKSGAGYYDPRHYQGEDHPQ